ncbi:MAG: metal-dependent transcriptional regulator [Clostridia bacterium]|nr:metal-dependent transcriptional regulator [Clostridia bacterium]MEE1502842.1 metal-dependent transcriptional regulator [Acutalibacteraceae bacterium]
MAIKESAENYLETILLLSQKNKSVRSIDIANEMNFTKASISVAMKKLREDGFITVDNDGAICLTSKGKSIAEKVYDRHQTIAGILIALGVKEETAYEDSCKIEHILSQESFEKIRTYFEKHR